MSPHKCLNGIVRRKNIPQQLPVIMVMTPIFGKNKILLTNARTEKTYHPPVKHVGGVSECSWH